MMLTRIFFLAGLGLFFSVGGLRAHSLHLSLAEADYRADSGKLEIALRLFSDDAEAALKHYYGQTVSMEKTPSAELDNLCASYIKEKFVVKARDGTPLAFTWVGHELKDANQHLWLYFESAVPGGVEGLRVASRVLREKFSDQLNSVRVRDHPPAGAAGAKAPTATRQVTLLFTDDEEQRVRFQN